MIQAISPVGGYVDSEYMKILQELMKLGIAPSGNKSIDKAKLEQAKQELIEKIKTKENNDLNENKTQPPNPVDGTDNSKRAEMEEQRLCAMTVAELNRIYFHI